MIKVRATQDGHYGGYYRNGPIESDKGTQPGEVFEVDDAVFEVKDEHDRPIYELDADGKKIPILANGKPKLDASGRPMFKIKTASLFSQAWMERVGDEEEITNDYPPADNMRKHGPLKVYLKPKIKASKFVPPGVQVAVPAVPVESPI